MGKVAMIDTINPRRKFQREPIDDALRREGRYIIVVNDCVNEPPKIERTKGHKTKSKVNRRKRRPSLLREHFDKMPKNKWSTTKSWKNF